MSLNLSYLTAIEDFHRMRRRAGLQKVFNRFRKHTSLLSYEDIRAQLRAVEKSGAKLMVIPLKAIQGSVGRYSDFTRDFLPTESINPQRWARVKAQFYSLEGVPPIEVYKIGEVYFVSDGNHRVSVARQMGNSTIEAYVKEVAAKVKLEVDEDVDQLLIKAEYAEFLDQTQFDQLYPEVNLMVTAPGCYKSILQQIEAIHFALEFDGNKTISYLEAIQYWFDAVFYPIIEAIREQGILMGYPGRTETDLYLWIFKHRASLSKTLEWEISPKSATKNLAQTHPSTFKRVYDQSKQLFHKVIRHQEFETGPPPGTWRQNKMVSPEGRLFANIIAVINDSERGWEALSQGINIAGLEGSNIFGLHVTVSDRPILKREQQVIQTKFGQRCESCNIRGQLAFNSGPIDQVVRERACWADLVVIYAQEITTTILSLIKSCPVPILILRNQNTEYKSLLLAYDGSPQSEEALFLSAYLATFWELSLTVITILENEHDQVTKDTILHTNKFLEYYGVPAQYLEIDHNPVESILQTARDQDSCLIVLGDYIIYSKTKTKKHILDEVLENSLQALMICR